jgi:hypothetical protein
MGCASSAAVRTVNDASLARTAYIIIAGCPAFSSQADYVTALQFLHILNEQQVPSENVFAWLPCDPDSTVQNPRSYPLGPQLFPPKGYERSVWPNRAPADDVYNLVRSFVDSRDFDALVFLYLNHGKAGSITLDQDEMAFDRFKSMFAPKPGFSTPPPKDILIILDCCYSARFAKNVMLQEPRQERLWILASSPTVSMTSTVVVSDCIELLNINPDGSHVDYAVFGTAMMRELMPLICYSSENVQLSALAARLNRRVADDKLRGFQASVFGQTDETGVTLRHFFGQAIRADKSVDVGPLKCEFRDVVLEIQDKGRFDDFHVAADKVSSVSARRFYRYVRITGIFDECGQIVGFAPVAESPYGFVPIEPDSEDAIAQQVIDCKGAEAPGREGKVHVPLCILLRVCMDGLEKSCAPISYDEEDRYFTEIHDALSEVNSFDGRDVYFLPYIAQYWGQKEFPQWVHALRQAHDAIIAPEKPASTA